MWEPKDFVSKTRIRDGAIVVEVRNLSHIIINRDSSLSLKTRICHADFVNRFGPLTTLRYFLKIGFDGVLAFTKASVTLVKPYSGFDGREKTFNTASTSQKQATEVALLK